MVAYLVLSNLWIAWVCWGREQLLDCLGVLGEEAIRGVNALAPIFIAA